MAIVQSITVGADLTVAHPHVAYSNIKPSVSVTILLQDGDDPAAVCYDLQVQVAKMVSQSIEGLLATIHQR